MLFGRAAVPIGDNFVKPGRRERGIGRNHDNLDLVETALDGTQGRKYTPHAGTDRLVGKALTVVVDMKLREGGKMSDQAISIDCAFRRLERTQCSFHHVRNPATM